MTAHRSSLGRAGAQLGRHASVYLAGSAIGLTLSLVSVIVLTRFLSPEDFGRLGLALVSTVLLTLGLNAPIGQGALIRSFGNAEEGDAEDATGEGAPESFGSALVATLTAGALASGLILVVSGLIDEPYRTTFGWVGPAGTAGALWRLLSTVPRLQRRPGRYVALATLRPVLVLGLSVPLVASGGGAEAAMAGVAGGTGLACVVAAVAARRTFVVAFDPADLRWMGRRSRPFLPLIIGTWLIQSADLYVVAAFASASEVGAYRLASRFAALVSYGTSSLLSAWGPLELGSAFRDADADHGRDAVRGEILHVFLLLVIWLVLGVVLLADELVRLAPADYAPAAQVLPYLGVAFGLQGILTATYRASSLHGRAVIYRRGSLYAGIVFLPLCGAAVVLAGPSGAGVAAAAVLAALIVIMVVRGSQQGAPLQVDGPRLVTALGAAAALAGVALLVPWPSDAWASAVSLAVLTAYLPCAVACASDCQRHGLRTLLGRDSRYRTVQR